MTFRSIILGFAAIAFGTMGQAQGLTFSFDNEFTEDLAIEFYSQDRNHVWPGGSDVYVLGTSDGAMSYSLSCQPGENICFGAWTQDRRNFWGGGVDMSESCEACCAVCDGSVLDTIELY